MIDAYLELLELGYFEVKFAFEGLANENVWKRPAEGLLSVGELAGHIAYWEAVRLARESEEKVSLGGEEGDTDLAQCRVSSPLIHPHFRYYSTTVKSQLTEQHLAMTAEQVCQELLRVHEESVAYFKAQNHDLKSGVPGWSPEWNYGEFLKYLVFHIGYHTGQMFSARHLLGEETPDN